MVIGEISSLEDNSGTLRAAWDANTLYFAIQVQDDTLVADSIDVWRDDGVELGIDGDYNHIRTTSPPDHQYTLTIDGRAADFGASLSEGTLVVKPRSGGYTMEFAIPAAHVLAQPFVAASALGFTWGIHDDDDGGNWDSWMVWEGNQTNTQYELFGRLFLSAYSMINPPTPTPSVSPTPHPTPTPTPANVPTPTSTPSPTPTSTLTPTPTPTRRQPPPPRHSTPTTATLHPLRHTDAYPFSPDLQRLRLHLRRPQPKLRTRSRRTCGTRSADRATCRQRRNAQADVRR